ncbi:MAG: cytochrome P450 [Burkholderiaceae bacterium]
MTKPATSPASAAPVRSAREIASLPGPSAWPVLGNLPQLQVSRMHQQLEQWASRYGSLYRLRMGGRDALVVADHALVAGVLRDRPDGFDRTARLGVIGAEMGMKQGVFGASGDVWRRQRRMVMAAFDPAHIKSYHPTLMTVAGRLERRWRKAAQAGTPIDLQADLMRYTVDAITGLAFGTDVNTLESDDEIIQRHLDLLLPALFKRAFSLVPWWRLYRTSADRELEAAMVEVNRAVDGFIAAARDRLAADPARRAAPPNLLEAMIVAAQDDAQAGGHGGAPISDAEIAGNVMTMLLAGEDTTANTIAWLIHLLVENPAALARARDEVLAKLGAPPDLAFEAVRELDYVEACAHEAMRLKPVAPMILAQALRETTVGDVRVPPGTVVFGLMRADAVDEAHVDEAAAFRPERWLDGSSGFDLGSPKRVSMPFGAGPRICPGRYLALLEIRMAIATLLASFDIVSLDTPDGAPPRENMAFTMEPVGLTLRLRERAS